MRVEACPSCDAVESDPLGVPGAAVSTELRGETFCQPPYQLLRCRHVGSCINLTSQMSRLSADTIS